jgi:hypothetical protein
VAFSGYKARERKQKRWREHTEKNEHRGKKKTEGQEKRKNEKNQRELPFNQQHIMPLLPSSSS